MFLMTNVAFPNVNELDSNQAQLELKPWLYFLHKQSGHEQTIGQNYCTSD